MNGLSLQFSSTERPHQRTSRVERSFSIALVNKVSLQWSSPSLNYHTANAHAVGFEPMLPYRATLLWSGRWDSNPLSAKATDLQSAPTLQLRRSPIIYEGNIRQHLLRFALQVWQENDLNLLSLRLIPFLKHGFVL